MGGSGSWIHSFQTLKDKRFNSVTLIGKQKTGREASWVILGIWTPVQLFWDSVVGVRECGEDEVIIAKTIS